MTEPMKPSVTQAHKDAAKRFCQEWESTHNLATYIEPALAEAFARFEAEILSRPPDSDTAGDALREGLWRTIDSAPQTGETILAICASAYTPTAFDTWWQDGWTHYSRPDGKWHGGVGKWFPTHWMPRESYVAALSQPSPDEGAGE